MKQILILGAGRSSGFLIEYLSQKSKINNWHITVVDQNTSSAQTIANQNSSVSLLDIDIFQHLNEIELLITTSTIVVSMLPAFLHPPIAKLALKHKKHFATASYVGEELKMLEKDIQSESLFFLNECGLDPGLDHMSAMKIIDSCKNENASILSFKSWCGGLISKESVGDNPWAYKFSWNPRNVILAGQSTARFILNNERKYLPYSRLFKEHESIRFQDKYELDGYANRDSLSYQAIYGLEQTKTLLRGTLRYKNFCNAWHVFVSLGLTDDSYTYNYIPGETTYFDFISSFLPATGSLTKRLLDFPAVNGNKHIFDMVEWTGILSNKLIPENLTSPAQILQHLLEEKWKLNPSDNDLVLMMHEFEIHTEKGELKRIQSFLECEGNGPNQTAMSKTVGLPLAYTIELFLKDGINRTGLVLPISPDIYTHVLNALEKEQGIKFVEEEVIFKPTN